MAERSLLEQKFKDIGLTILGGEPVSPPSRIQIAKYSSVDLRQQDIAGQIINPSLYEARSKLDPTGLRLTLSQGAGFRGVIELPSGPSTAPWIKENNRPVRAFMTLHPDSNEDAGIIRLKVFMSNQYWVSPQMDPYRLGSNTQTVDDAIGASVTLGRGGHKKEENTDRGVVRDTVVAAQPAHTALVIGTSFAQSRPLEKVSRLSPNEAPHYVDTQLKAGAGGFTPELAATSENDPSALTNYPETLWPAISISDMENLLATRGSGLTQAELGRYRFYTFVGNCYQVIQTEHINEGVYREAMAGRLVLPISADPTSVATYQAELLVGLTRKGPQAVDQAIKTMEQRTRQTNW